mmetsp:Transcript_4066/g.12646  ORF Transcript_4066/g.12646 Transcript_4066/m.12646 type:complete len:723 (-) Transcript_4066:267-2435(-)
MRTQKEKETGKKREEKSEKRHFELEFVGGVAVGEVVEVDVFFGVVFVFGVVQLDFELGVEVQRRQIQPALEEAEHAGVEGLGVVGGEAGLHERVVEEQPGEVVGGLVVGFGGDDGVQFGDDGVAGVDLHGFLRLHVRGLGLVREGLGSHDALHVRGVAVLRRDDDAGRGLDALRDDDLGDGVAVDVLHVVGERLELVLVGGFALLLEFFVFVAELEAFLGHGLELLAVELGDVLDGVLVDGVRQVQDFHVLGREFFQEGRLLDGGDGLAGDEVNRLLPVLHGLHVLFQRRPALAGLVALEAQEFRQFRAVRVVLDDAQLDVLPELLPEHQVRVLLVFFFFVGVLQFVVFLLFQFVVLVVVVLFVGRRPGGGELPEHFEGLADEFLGHDLENFVLLQRLATDVERQVVRVDDAPQEVQVPRHQVLELVGNQDFADVEPQLGGFGVVGVVHVEGDLARHEQDAFEFHFSLRLEVDPRRRVHGVLRQRLVERLVLVVRHVLGVARPDGLLRIHLRPVPRRHLLRLRRRVVFLFLVVFLVLLLVVLFVVGGTRVQIVFFFFLFHGHGFGGGLVEVDGKGDELRVAQHQLFEAVLVQELARVFFQEERNFGASAERLAVVLPHLEVGVGGALPDVLVVVVVLGPHPHFVRHEVHRVKPDAELADQRQVAAALAARHGLHEVRRARPRDRAQVRHQVLLRHAHARVRDRQRPRVLVEGNPDLQLFLRR